MTFDDSLGTARRKNKPYARALPAACLLMALAPLHAQTSSSDAQPTPTQPIPTVTIYGTTPKSMLRVTEDPAAAPASVTVIDRRELDRRTINTYGDILRGVTGLSVLEYGQGLVAYDVQARGFDGGHGRNVAVFLDGMPLNVTGSQHTNGYADLAQLIPELLDRVEITRGPFSVLAGNHAVGASIHYTTEARRDSSIKATVDAFGRVRVLPIGSFAAGPGTALIALDATKGKGYTDQSDLERANLFARYTAPIGRGVASLRAQAYHATADAPGYLDRDLVLSGAIDDKSALAQGIGDAKNQRNVVLNYRSDDIEGASGTDSGWFAALYANNDLRKRWTHFDLGTAPGSRVDLGQERDHLRQAGFDVRKNTSFKALGWPAQWQLGLQLNRERIDALNVATDADRNALAPSASRPDVIGIDRQVTTTTQALYTQLQVLPLARLKLTAGLRYDSLRFETDLHPNDDTYAAALTSGQPVSIDKRVHQASPKLGAAYALLDGGRDVVELFGNAARGLKSPYAFSDFYGNVGVGDVPDLSISSLRSVETGLQGRSVEGAYQWRMALWSTRQDREADRNAAGFLSSLKKTRRDGIDLEGQLSLSRDTRVLANLSHVRARIDAPATSGADHIPNVPEWSAMLGADTQVPVGQAPLALSLMVNLVGPQSITTDDSLRTRAYQRITARAAYPLPGLKDAVVSLNLVAYSRRYEETAFDFGGGAVGISPRPRLHATLGLQLPF